MSSEVLFEDVIVIVNEWFKNNKYILQKHNIQIDERQCNDSGHWTIFEYNGDYCAQLGCDNLGYSPYRYIIFDVLQISTGNMIYYWIDDDNVPLEAIEGHLDNAMQTFIDLVKSDNRV